MGRELPSGVVTFVFTDIEGSTRLLHELGAAGYAKELSVHRRALRDAFARLGGVEVDTQGDAFFYAFGSAGSAVEACNDGQRALSAGPIRVRMGIHTGTPEVTEEGYVGEDVHKGARIGAAGHGGQVLLSRETRDLVEVDALDLGEHRLKDFAEPVWIFQLGRERFPPLKTISNTNLPRPASSFVGRSHEVDRVVALLQNGARLLTLTGPGGSGKTRLAIEAAAELVPDHRNGVFWVGLATLRDPALVSDAIVKTLGATEGLAEYIAQREMLLLLDNFEQVVDAAPELPPLLEACRNLRLLVTSRELLRVRGEVEFAVPPLDKREAVELFNTRSGLPVDDTIAELCRRLDHLPLAVELAAARTSVLSPTQILDRLSSRLDLFKGGRDADPRQATLRAAIEWSHELLATDEQRLFARLAVFAGGCTLDAAQDVADGNLDVLQSLVDKSLVRHSDERFWMLETIREYAIERLLESNESEELHRRHANFFLALSGEAAPHLRRESAEWLDRMEPELDNIRATLEHLESSGDGESALKLMAAVWWVWASRGSLREGVRRLEGALQRDLRPTPARAHALIGAADMIGDLGDPEQSGVWLEEALVLCRQLGDLWGEAYCLMGLGFPFAERDQWLEARSRFGKSAELFTKIGDRYWALAAARRLAWTYEELGNFQRARALREENLNEAREVGDKHTEAQTLAWLAEYEITDGRAERAIPLLREAHAIHRGRQDTADRYWDAIILCRIAGALVRFEQAATAACLLSCWAAIFEEIYGREEPWLAKKNGQTLAIIKQQLDDSAFAEAQERGRTLTIDAAISLGLEALQMAIGPSG